VATDLFGQDITANSDAATAYRTAINDLLEGSDPCDGLDAAIAADETFGLAAVTRLAFGALDEEESSVVGEAAARRALAHATRRERQHAEVLLALGRGDHERTCALAVEHLREYPRDLPVAWAAMRVPGVAAWAPQLEPPLRAAADSDDLRTRRFADRLLRELLN
jgi:hypothetical protein